MKNFDEPLIPAAVVLPEITVKVVFLSILTAVILAAANAFLALKIGVLTSASIPAAVLAMGLLKFFKHHNVLEVNLIQTAASAGEAVAGGIVYTVPALIMIHYWFDFSYWQNACIALLGGFLGVMFSVPLRRILVTDPKLPFPEGRAIAEVLKARSSGKQGFHHLIYGGLFGGFLELAQSGFKVLASQWDTWFLMNRSIVGGGLGFSPALIGAGYLIGFEMAFSIFLGALIAMLAVPVLTHLYPAYLAGAPSHMVNVLRGEKLIYIGIGGMLFAGIWTFGTLVKPFISSMKNTLHYAKATHRSLLRTDRDIPVNYIVGITLFLSLGLGVLLWHLFPFSLLGMDSAWNVGILIFAMVYILLMGFIFCAITAYFSGMVGVSATPGSAIIIGGLLIAALGLMAILYSHFLSLTPQQVLGAEVITILIGAVITSAAAISNDNMQDLKVGYLVGSTPWKQQIMLLLGVLVSAMLIPMVMHLLFQVYGIGNVVPRPNMDLSQTLPAPPAAVMAALTQAMFHLDLPWDMMIVGIFILLGVLCVNHFLKNKTFKLSVLGVAIGIYLPLSSSMPLFIGGLMSWISLRHAHQMDQKYMAILIASGLLAGAALMDVILAIPFSYYQSSDVLRVIGFGSETLTVILSVLATVVIGLWFYQATSDKSS